MFLPSFRHLIEIEALKTQNQNDRERISNEQKRISDIEVMRTKRTIKITELSEELRLLKLTEKQLEIEGLEQKFKKTKSQMDFVKTEKENLALQSQIDLLQNELRSREEHYFLSLERAEKIDEEKKEAHTFLEGSLKTLAEIGEEVALEVSKYEAAIIGREKRFLSLEAECNKSLLTFYHELEKKFTPKRPVAYLIDKKCNQCHMQVDSVFKASLEEGRSFETCPTCGRLLIPETAKIY